MATEKQKRVLEKILENKGNVSKAMREVGYSANYSNNPQELTRTKGFQELLRQVGATPEKIAKRINEGLDADRTVVMGKDEDSFVDIQPDYAVRHKYVETSLKLYGLANETSANNFLQIIKEQKNKYGI